MLARKCDRCNDLYENETVKVDGYKTNAIRTTLRDSDNRLTGSRVDYDLCPRCLYSFIDWLEMEE